MEKFITDERTGLQYELVGDYYLIAGEDEPEGRPIGICEQRHLRYIRKHKVGLYAELLKGGRGKKRQPAQRAADQGKAQGDMEHSHGDACDASR